MFCVHYPCPADPSRDFAYSTNLKVACSSILRLLADTFKVPSENLLIHNPHWHKIEPAELIARPEIFSFTFVRNPWDRVVSRWAHLKRKGLMKASFEVWATKQLSARRCTDWHFHDQWRRVYTQVVNADGIQVLEQYIQFVGRLEHLQRDWNYVRQATGLGELPHENAAKHEPYQSYYSEVTRELVARKFARDIDLFGYEF